MSEVLTWLNDNYPKEVFTPGFKRLDLALTLFNFNFKNKKVITVAGTNGKGTIARTIFNNLKSNLKRTSLFTSPHLVSITERFTFSDINLDESSLLKEFILTHKLLVDEDIHLSFYEFTLIIFLRLSKDYDYIVLEVGLGGRLDATNRVDADFAILTSIARDHTEILGNSFKKILFEKLGIVKNKTTFISSFENEYLLKLTENKLSKISKKNIIEFKRGASLKERNNFIISSLFNELQLDTTPTELRFVSVHCERLKYSCCHNLSAVRNLVNNKSDFVTSFNRPIMLISYSHRDIKELEYMSKLFLKLRPYVDQVYLTHIDQFKAARIEDIKKISRDLNIPFIDKIKINEFIETNKNFYISGSNYFVGDFISHYESALCSR